MAKIMTQVKCSICLQDKNEIFFYRRKNGRLRRDCKNCCKERSAVTRIKNPNYNREYRNKPQSRVSKSIRDKIYYAKNKNRHSAKSKEYNLKNRDRLLLQMKNYYRDNRHKAAEYHQANRERILKRHKEWRLKNKERVQDYSKRYRKNKIDIIKRLESRPHYRLSKSISFAIRKSLRNGKAGKRWELIVGYSLSDLIQHIEKQFDDKMSWENYGRYWHLDHIIPKNKFNYSSYFDEEFKRCWALDNLQPLEAKANLKKSNKIIQFPNQFKLTT